jgi:hypothetical protein
MFCLILKRLSVTPLTSCVSVQRFDAVTQSQVFALGSKIISLLKKTTEMSKTFLCDFIFQDSAG